MPAGLPPTPWIRSYDTPQMYLGGVHAGASIGEANARIAAESSKLQQQANMSAMEMELQQKQMEQKSRLEQQQMEISKAYHQAQLGIQQQKLDAARKLMEAKTLATARQYQEQQAYIADVQGKMDPIQAALKHPGMYASPGDFSAAIRESQRDKQATINERIKMQAEEARDIRQETTTRMTMARTALGNIEESMRQLHKNLADAIPSGKAKTIDPLRQELRERQSEYNRVERMYGLPETRFSDESGWTPMGKYRIRPKG